MQALKYEDSRLKIPECQCNNKKSLYEMLETRHLFKDSQETSRRCLETTKR